MSTASEDQAARPDDAKSGPAELPDSESQLKRMDPDSILADDADPDQVLGNDSSSDAATKRNSAFPASTEAGESDLKRASAASAIFSQGDSTEQSSPRALTDSISTDHRDGSDTQVDAHTLPKTMSTEELQAQISDLTNQVTGLNEKLVKSFNRIADLEDDYSEAQDTIRNMSTKIKELEKERTEHLDALNTGLLVEKAHVSSEMQRMMDRVIEETAQRGKAESDKSKIEAELDELSSSLFSEANKMVAVERLSRARAEEKSRNMEERLKDTEGIMLEQQKVLADLQRQVEKLQSDSTCRKLGDDSASIMSLESDAVSFHRLNTSSLARSISQRTAVREFKHKPTADLSAQARLIINIVPYQEFRSFIAHLRKLRRQLAPFYNYPLHHAGARDSLNATPTPRTASPAPQQGTSAVAATTNSIATASSAYSQGIGGALYSSSPFAIAGVSRHRDYPTLPSNVESFVSLPNQLSLPFIKRSQEEDVDPCLRLDFAPGLNWLSRRQANTAILDGNLVIEPIFSGSQTIDEDRIRRENAHLPPAACAMCGIPVVNVPLPGGVAATAMSSEQGGKTSLVPSSIATATSSWASSAASSLGSITGSSSSGPNSGTITPKPSRGGLFSSFRRSSGTNKPADAEVAANASAEVADAQTDAPIEAMVSPNLPVPTHIFRLSESAPTRYLLCPHHCLLRLRAACQFWGFVRNLERSVVLEGKFMNDEAHPLAASTSSLDLAKQADAPKSQQVETLEKAVAAAEMEESSAPGVVEPTEPAKGNADGTAETDAESGEKTEAEKVKESVQDEIGESAAAEDQGETAVEDEEAPAAEKSEDKGEEDKELSADADEEATDAAKKEDDDDFADAPSSPTKAKASDAADGDKDDKKATDGVAEGAGAESKVESDAVPKPDAGGAAADASGASDAAGASAPPLPPRSVARATGAVSPAPAVPPRRPPRAGAALAVPPQRTSSAPARAPTPANSALALDSLDAMEWEDRMWTQLTKLKQELWRARIGLVTDQTELA